jgi:endonuclease/exonuclease/phosphatase family metal-dependent hydrolase
MWRILSSLNINYLKETPNMKKFIFMIALCTMLSGCHTRLNSDKVPQKPAGSFRLATYNVNWGNGAWGHPNPKARIHVLKETRADIVLLQEVTPFWQKLLKRTLGHRYPYRRYYHYPKAGGIAILSKWPITNKKYIKLPEGWHPHQIAFVRSPYGTLQIANVHLTPPLNEKEKTGLLANRQIKVANIHKQEARLIIQHLNPKMRTLVAGDFNEGDGGFAVRFFKDFGLNDVYDTHARGVTWHWPKSILPIAGRYDRIFYSPQFKLLDVAVIQRGGSDHFPVLADFRLKRG